MKASLVFLGLMAPAVTFGLPYDEINPKWSQNARVVRLSDSRTSGLIGAPRYYEFSSDSKYFAIWHYENTEPYDFHNPPDVRVWDLEGKQVPGAIDKTRLFLVPEYRALFNECALRAAPEADYNNGRYAKFTPYPDIAKYAMGWFISSDWQYMAIFRNDLSEKWLRELETNQNACKPHFDTVAIEFWQLGPEPKKVWESQYKGLSNPEMGYFYVKDGSLCLIIADFIDANIYSCKDGRLLESFRLYNESTAEELENRIKRFGLGN
jgi:hypothetical protein